MQSAVCCGTSLRTPPAVYKVYAGPIAGAAHSKELICMFRSPAWCPTEVSPAMAPSRSKDSATSPRVVIQGFSNDDDLDIVWTQVVAQCSAITNWNLEEKKNPSIEDVLSKMKPSMSTPEKHTTAKKIFSNTLKCVQRLGEIAANSAAMVFSPSQVREPILTSGCPGD
jgi:hypothetical protein